MRPRALHFSSAWSKDSSLTAFLIVLVLTVFIIAPLGRLTTIGALLISLFFSFLLISGVAAVAEHRTQTLLAAGLVTITLGFRWMAYLIPSPGIESAGACLLIACLGLMTGVVLFQVFREGPITWHRIQGAIAAYLLLGLTWGVAYEAVLLQLPGAFLPATLSEQSGPILPTFVYFSFVTLTTVGYGDIIPVHPMVRSLANLEALVGQLYPAILIGRLVAMELQFRQMRS